jgi:hypothetical protein
MTSPQSASQTPGQGEAQPNNAVANHPQGENADHPKGESKDTLSSLLAVFEAIRLKIEAFLQHLNTNLPRGQDAEHTLTSVRAQLEDAELRLQQQVRIFRVRPVWVSRIRQAERSGNYGEAQPDAGSGYVVAWARGLYDIPRQGYDGGWMGGHRDFDNLRQQEFEEALREAGLERFGDEANYLRLRTQLGEAELHFQREVDRFRVQPDDEDQRFRMRVAEIRVDDLHGILERQNPPPAYQQQEQNPPPPYQQQPGPQRGNIIEAPRARALHAAQQRLAAEQEQQQQEQRPASALPSYQQQLSSDRKDPHTLAYEAAMQRQAAPEQEKQPPDQQQPSSKEPQLSKDRETRIAEALEDARKRQAARKNPGRELTNSPPDQQQTGPQLSNTSNSVETRRTLALHRIKQQRAVQSELQHEGKGR